VSDFESYGKPENQDAHETLQTDPAIQTVLDELRFRDLDFGIRVQEHFAGVANAPASPWFNDSANPLEQQTPMLEYALVCAALERDSATYADGIDKLLAERRQGPPLERVMTLSVAARFDGLVELPTNMVLGLLLSHPCDLVNAAVRSAWIKRNRGDLAPVTAAELCVQVGMITDLRVPGSPQNATERDRRAHTDLALISTDSSYEAKRLTEVLFARFQVQEYPQGFDEGLQS